MSQMEDLYEILQVQPSAESEVIQAAYRRLAREYHPDLDDSAEAVEMLRLLNSAYETVNDPIKRAAYDLERASLDSQSIAASSDEAADSPETTNATNLGDAAALAPRRGTGVNVRLWSIISLLVLLVVGGIIAGVILTGGGEEGPRLVVRGRSLELHASEPNLVDKIAFLDGQGNHRVLRPRASNRQLAMIDVTIVNRTSLVTPLLVDPDAAKLGDRRSDRISPLNPFERAEFVDAASPDEDMFKPFLWGEVELDKNFQVQGWMVFDVPKGLILGTLWWEEVDSIVADYVDYELTRTGGPRR